MYHMELLQLLRTGNVITDDISFLLRRCENLSVLWLVDYQKINWSTCTV